MPLTTRYKINQWAGLESDVNAARLDIIIPQVSATIEAYLGRNLELTTHRQWLDGQGHPDMCLPEYPINKVYGISTKSMAVMRVKNTSGKFATISSDDDGIILFSISSAGVEAESTLAFATYPTCGLLAAAIAAVSGWTATLETGKSDEPSKTMRPNSGSWCLSPDTVALECADHTENIRINLLTDRMIRRAGGITASTTDWELGDLVFPAGCSNIFCWWSAGYTFPVDSDQHSSLSIDGNVPKDLEMVCNVACKALFDAAEQDLSAGNMNLGDYSFSLSDGERAIVQKVLNDNRNILAKYQRFL